MKRPRDDVSSGESRGSREAKEEDSAGMVKMLSRQVANAAKSRKAAVGVKQCTELPEPATGTGFFALKVDYSSASTVPVSRVKAGRSIMASQLEYDMVLRVPRGSKTGADDAAFALEVLVGARRWRLDVATQDVAALSMSKATLETRLECATCGRRFGSQSHFDAHSAGPCSSGTAPSRESSTTFRVELRNTRQWAYETAVLPTSQESQPTWRGAPGAWAESPPLADPLNGEIQRVGLLTIRLRQPADASVIAALLKTVNAPTKNTVLTDDDDDEDDDEEEA